MAQVTGTKEIPAFRPPHGDVDSAVVQGAASEGDDLYLGDIDSGGFKRGETPGGAAASVLKSVRPGSIVLMHPLAPADRGRSGR